MRKDFVSSAGAGGEMKDLDMQILLYAIVLLNFSQSGKLAPKYIRKGGWCRKLSKVDRKKMPELWSQPYQYNKVQQIK